MKLPFHAGENRDMQKGAGTAIAVVKEVTDGEIEKELWVQVIIPNKDQNQ
jgi:hypothetical protein